MKALTTTFGLKDIPPTSTASFVPMDGPSSIWPSGRVAGTDFVSRTLMLFRNWVDQDGRVSKSSSCRRTDWYISQGRGIWMYRSRWGIDGTHRLSND